MLTDLISIKPTTSSDYMGVALKSYSYAFPIRYVFLLRTGSNQGFNEVLSRQDSITDIAVHETGKLAASIDDGSSNRKFLYSTNKGGKWDSIYTGLSGAIAFQACYESHLFYRQGNNMYRYQYGDTAATLWMPLESNLYHHQLLDENTMVAFSPVYNRFVYTTNRGQNWIVKEAPFPGVVLHQTFVDGKVYRSNKDGVYVSADTGSTWTLIARGVNPRYLQILSGKLYAVSSILNKSFVTTPDSTYIPPAANLPRKMIMKPGSKFYYAMSGSHPDVHSKYEVYEIDRDTIIPQNGKTYLIPKGPVKIPGEVSYPDRIFDLPFRYDTVANKYYVWESGAEKLRLDFSNSNSIYSFWRAASPQLTCSVTVSAQSHLGMPIISHEARFMTQDGTLEESRSVSYCDTLGIYSYFHHYYVYVHLQWGILRNLIMAKINLGDTTVYYSTHYKPEFAIEPKQTLSVTKYNQYFRLSHYLTHRTNVDTVCFIDSIRITHYYKRGSDSISLPDLYLEPHFSAEYHYPMTLDSSLFTQGYTYYYRITATDKSLIPEATTVPETGFFAVNYDPAASVDDGEVPQSFALEQNYPNPFNPSTTISYTIPKSGRVTLKVYSVLGSEVATLHDGYQSAGTHSVEFNAADLPSGVYFYRLEAGDQSSTKKLLLLK